MDLSIGQSHVAAWFYQSKHMKRVRESVTVFYNLISEVISLHFCRILGIRSKSLGPALTHEEEITQWHEYQEAGIIGSHSDAAYHTM